jgi:hypothetical protein
MPLHAEVSAQHPTKMDSVGETPKATAEQDALPIDQYDKLIEFDDIKAELKKVDEMIRTTFGDLHATTQALKIFRVDKTGEKTAQLQEGEGQELANYSEFKSLAEEHQKNYNIYAEYVKRENLLNEKLARAKLTDG